jgi:ribosomal protein S18 acetylase RimI-like enzyme
MSDITIREAALHDLETLLRFEQGVIGAERPFDPTLGDDPIRYYDIKEMIRATHIQLVVAEVDGALAGCGYARIEDAKPYLKHRQYAYLGFMYTEPEYRGRGINQRIIDSLKEWSLSRGITEMRLEVYAGNLVAQKAYVKAGFDRHMIEMRQELNSKVKI